MSDPDSATATKLAEVYSRLGEAYSLERHHRPVDAVDELVMTILSQNTSDTNTRRTFRALKEAYPNWQAVIDAPTGELVEVIRSGGLAQQKAPRIQRALRRIQAERDEFDLDWLADLPVDEARAWLTGIKGVGAKTASITLLFALDRPAFAVDTHVGRVLRRLGVAPARASADKVMHIVEAAAPPEWFYPLHINLIRHGRQICTARNPSCEACVLNDICDWWQERQVDE